MVYNIIRLKAVSYNCHDWALQMNAGFWHAHMSSPSCKQKLRQAEVPGTGPWQREIYLLHFQFNVPTPAAWYIHQAPTAAQLTPSIDCEERLGALAVLHPKQGVTVGSHPRNTGRADRWMKACSMSTYFWQVVWPLLLISGSVKEPASSFLPTFPSPFPVMAPC